ncbi:cell envelope integrity protein TolA [Bdellovibrionota bacterium FG-1]
MTHSMAALAEPPRPPQHIADQGFGRSLQVSAFAHVFLLLLALIKGFVFPGTPKPYTPTLRVDMVALPDLLKKDLQNLSPAKSQSDKEIAAAIKNAEVEAKKIKPIKLPIDHAEPDELVLHPKRAPPKADAKPKKDNRDLKLIGALARIKALNAIDKSDQAPSTRGAVVKGNQLSAGTSLSGDAKEGAETSYYDALRSKLQDNWELPVWIARQNLSAQVQIFIDSYGHVRSYQFVKTSGNPQFDSAIKKTLDESQPFPRPPADLAPSLRIDGILIGFPL